MLRNIWINIEICSQNADVTAGVNFSPPAKGECPKGEGVDHPNKIFSFL
jgi:hypothetical protein